MSNRPLIFALISIAGNLDGDDIDDNNETQEDPQEMSTKPTAKAAATAAAATTYKAAGKPKTNKTNKTEGDFLPSSRTLSKLYGFGTEDVYAVSFDSEGTTDYCVV